jgi:hypothetical protein
MRLELRFLLAVACFAMLSSVGQAAGQSGLPNFSGKYEMKPGGGSLWGRRILVVQGTQSADVSWLSQGHPVTYHFPLDGSQLECSTAPDGTDASKCSGSLQKNKLTLKMTYKERLRVEEWKLSKDGKKLTIESQSSTKDMVLRPDSPDSVSTVQKPTNFWGTAEFNRVEGP